MSYLLDTCVPSEFLKKKPDQKTVVWFGKQLEESLYFSVLTIGEIQKGITRLDPSKRRTELELWLESIIYRYDRRILPLTVEIAVRWGIIKGELETQGTVLPVIDGLIAATALEHDLTVVTRNVADFSPTGVKILNLWD